MPASPQREMPHRDSAALREGAEAERRAERRRTEQTLWIARMAEGPGAGPELAWNNRWPERCNFAVRGRRARCIGSDRERPALPERSPEPPAQAEESPSDLGFRSLPRPRLQGEEESQVPRPPLPGFR